MTKLEQLKASQGYRLSAATCRTCKHFTSDKETRKGYFGGEYTKEKNKRCRLGGFKVKVTATCLKWEEK
jgi:hypothetical protein